MRVNGLTRAERRFFRDSLRDARAVALRDAEASSTLIFALERVGAFLHGEKAALKDYERALTCLAEQSPLGRDLPKRWRAFHTPIDVLLTLVREGRNSAMHEGSYGRHLTGHAIELSLILEDALMTEESKTETVGDFMVRFPVCAEPWQPLSFIRHSLLANSFSYLPVKQASSNGAEWRLVSDHEVAGFLRAASSNNDRTRRLSKTLAEAVEAGEVALEDALICRPETSVLDVIEKCNGLPVLVCSSNGDLLGIATPFDLL